MIMESNFSFKTFFSSKYFILFISFVLSIFLWLMVSILVDPNTILTIKDVNISNYSEALVKSFGVDVVKKDVEKIDITVQGNRNVVGFLTQKDFIVNASSETNILGPGEYIFNIAVTKKDPLKDFKILQVNKSKVNVTLARLESKTLKVDIEYKNINIEEGYLLGDITTTPSEKIIKGPDDVINQIEKVSVSIVENDLLNDSKTYQKEVKFFDKNNNQIDSSKLYIEDNVVEVKIPVLKKIKVPLKLNFFNYPSNLDFSNLKYSLSSNEIEIAGPKDKVDTIKQITLGDINMNQFNKDGKFVFPINLPTGFISADNILSVVVAFDKSLLATRYFNITNLSIINTPNNFNVQIITKKISNVEMIGLTQEIQSMYYNDLIAEIDISNIELAIGEIKVPVNIKSSSKNNVWPLGVYNAVIKVSHNPK